MDLNLEGSKIYAKRYPFYWILWLKFLFWNSLYIYSYRAGIYLIFYVIFECLQADMVIIAILSHGNDGRGKQQKSPILLAFFFLTI